jgi:flagellar hook-associated protein 1 FlgK
VVSNNLANSLTEGYARRELDTSSYFGGVKVNGITRSVDPSLIGDRRIAEARLNADQRVVSMLNKIESIFGVQGDGDNLPDRLADFETALVSASSDPASNQRLTQLNNTLGALAGKLQGDSRKVQTLRQEADIAIRRDVETLNANLKMVEKLNVEILRARAVGQDPSSIFDARQLVVDEIGGLVSVRELNRGSDQLGLMTTSGLVLLDGKAAQFDFTQTPTIIADMTLTSGALGGMTRNGVPLDASDGFGRLSGGAIGSAFKLRDDVLGSVQQSLDEVAFSLVTRFSDPLVDPTVGAVGLLTDAGVAANPSDIVGLASRVSVNAAVDPDRGGSLSNWRDGVGAILSGSIGNSAQQNRWLNALQADAGPQLMSMAGQVASLSSEISLNRVNSEKELSFSTARWDSLHSAELAGGVDSDVELQNLLRVEQAYAANAKVIQTISAMIQQILEI